MGGWKGAGGRAGEGGRAGRSGVRGRHVRFLSLIPREYCRPDPACYIWNASRHRRIEKASLYKSIVSIAGSQPRVIQAPRLCSELLVVEEEEEEEELLSALCVVGPLHPL